MTTTVLSQDTATVVDDRSRSALDWGAVIAGALVAAATSLFLVMLGAGLGLVLISGTGALLTLGGIWVLASQAFGFAAGGHVAGRLIGPMVESRRAEEFRAGLHGLVTWAFATVAGLALLALVAAGGMHVHGPAPDTASTITGHWADILLAPDSDHALAHGEDLNHDKQEAARVLAADLMPNADHAANRADLARLVVMDAGLSHGDALDRINYVESRLKKDLDDARKAAGYGALWMALGLLFGAVVSVAAAISARWEDDKLHFSWARRV